MPKRHPFELKEQARNLYASGKTCLETAERLDIGVMTVWRWVREIGPGARSRPEAAKRSPKVQAAIERALQLSRQNYQGSERHMANMIKMRSSPKFKEAARKAAANARAHARETWIGSPRHLAHLARLHQGLRERNHFREMSRLASNAKNTRPERAMRTLLASIPEAEGFCEQYLIDLRVAHTRADFAWPEKWLVLFVDGPVHYRWERNQVHDNRIERLLHATGWRVIRIPDEMLSADPESFGTYIATLLRAHRVIVIETRSQTGFPVA